MPAVIRPAMSDGRSLTNWMSSCELNAMLASKFNAQSQSDYRAHLQANPRVFDLATKGLSDFTNYYAVNGCSEAAKAHQAKILKYSPYK